MNRKIFTNETITEEKALNFVIKEGLIVFDSRIYDSFGGVN